MAPSVDGGEGDAEKRPQQSGRKRNGRCEQQSVDTRFDAQECSPAAAAAAEPRDTLLRELVFGKWDDEEEDEDWDPQTELVVQWFCTNCTWSNVADSTHCGLCGEHQNSAILDKGHFADPLVSAQESTQVAVETRRKTKVSKTTAIGFDERMLLHSEVQMRNNPHPERPDRLRSILSAFKVAGIYPDRCILIPSREISRAELEAVHTHEQVDAVEATADSEFSYFNADTYANKHSSLAAKLAGGICADLASAIVNGEAKNGFALVRPPGHHAEGDIVMGFCLHNNACLAAKAAQAAGAKKVLIVDWDVHHGNGTQEIFERDPTVLYISLHRYEGDFYPGTGAAQEVGTGAGEGFSVNIPWGCKGIGDNDYILAFLHVVLPIAKQFAPDIVIISAGFDAARGDPLGGFQVTPAGFAQMTQLLSTLSGGKLLVVLEGGYNLRSISASATAVLKVLVGDASESIPEGLQPSEAGLATLLEVFAVQVRYWPALSVPDVLKLTSQHAAINGRLKERSEERRAVLILASGRAGTADVFIPCRGTDNASLMSLNPERARKRKRKLFGPLWWNWGRRRLVYRHWFRIGVRLN